MSEGNAEWTEGMMKGAGCEGEEPHGEGGVKALEAAVPGWGAARERRWRPCSMTSIVVVVVIVVLIVALIVVVVKIRKGEM